jgi:hypothetical protein
MRRRYSADPSLDGPDQRCGHWLFYDWWYVQVLPFFDFGTYT